MTSDNAVIKEDSMKWKKTQEYNYMNIQKYKILIIKE